MGYNSVQFSSIQQICVGCLLSVGHRAGFLLCKKGACLFLGTGATGMVFVEMVRGGAEQEHREAAFHSIIPTAKTTKKLPLSEGSS